jgi:Helix-turn-helix domain
MTREREKANEMKQPNINSTLPQILTTKEAAATVNRKPQTLRKWACFENGPIRPIRINGRLAWHVKDLEALINGVIK